MSARSWMLLACAMLGVGALGAPVVIRLPVSIIYNASDSVPRGWYRVRRVDLPRSLRAGSIVLARLPASAATLAAERGYLPAGVPILKPVGAMASQHVCVQGDIVNIDGAVVATVRARDGALRPLRSWKQCRHLRGDEVFLLSRANPASFDSRYFGPIRAADVIGIAQPLRTEGGREPG